MDKLKKKIYFIFLIIGVLAGNIFVLALPGKSVPIEVEKLKGELPYIKFDISIPYINDKSNQIYTSINETIKKDIIDWKSDLVDLAKRDEIDAKEKGLEFRQYDLVSTYSMGINNKDILSLYIDNFQYTGGAHGITTRNTYTYDLVSGNRLNLTDLFKDSYDYKTPINKFIGEEIAKNPEYYFKSGKNFAGIKNKQDYYVSDEGIVIVFQLYEIAPYASGIREFTIPFSLVKDGLKYKF